MPRKRLTYQERVQRGLRRGYTRSQAVGRPRKGELSIREMETGIVSEQKMGEMRELSLKAHAQGRKWSVDPWFSLPQSFIEDLDHESRDFIFGY